MQLPGRQRQNAGPHGVPSGHNHHLHRPPLPHTPGTPGRLSQGVHGAAPFNPQNIAGKSTHTQPVHPLIDSIGSPCPADRSHDRNHAIRMGLVNNVGKPTLPAWVSPSGSHRHGPSSLVLPPKVRRLPHGSTGAMGAVRDRHKPKCESPDIHRNRQVHSTLGTPGVLPRPAPVDRPVVGTQTGPWASRPHSTKMLKRGALRIVHNFQ